MRMRPSVMVCAAAGAALGLPLHICTPEAHLLEKPRYTGAPVLVMLRSSVVVCAEAGAALGLPLIM